MKKFKFNNNKGFVLVETLVVAVAVTVIFGITFKHFYPLMGEYERREDYDDIDSKYGTFWFKRLIQSDDYQLSSADITAINTNGFTVFSCDNITDEVKKKMCNKLLVSLEVSCDDKTTENKIEECTPTRKPHIYITKFRLVNKDASNPTNDYNIKEIMKNDSSLSDGLKEYIDFLPNYSRVNSLNKANYRIIIEYYRHRFDTQRYSGDSTSYIVDEPDYQTYSTIEVKK